MPHNVVRHRRAQQIVSETEAKEKHATHTKPRSSTDDLSALHVPGSEELGNPGGPLQAVPAVLGAVHAENEKQILRRENEC